MLPGFVVKNSDSRKEDLRQFVPKCIPVLDVENSDSRKKDLTIRAEGRPGVVVDHSDGRIGWTVAIVILVLPLPVAAIVLLRRPGSRFRRRSR